MTNVAVVGAAGRMGATVCRAVLDREGLELVAAVDPARAGRPLAELPELSDATLVIEHDLRAVLDAAAEVLVDFTVADAARANLRFASEHGVHAVCGTTGLDASDIAELRMLFPGASGVNAVVSPNFAISAVLMMRLAELCAPWFDSAEIIELHHDQKRDAPSGTAMETARRIAAARTGAGAGDFGADPTERVVLEGARGGAGPANVHLHAVRLRGLVAHQEVLFGAPGQSLTIRQDSYDRISFMPGVLLAVERVSETPGLTLGLDRLLGL